MSSSSSSVHGGNKGSVQIHDFVNKQMIFLRDHLKTLAGKLNEDDELLGATADIKKSLLAKALKVLEVEQYNSIMAESVDRNIRESKVLEAQRRHLAEQLREGNGDNNTNNGDGAVKTEQAPPATTDNSNTKRKLAVIVDEATKELNRRAPNFRTNQWYRGLEADLQTEEEGDGDADFSIQTTGPKESDFVCPYTNVKYSVPVSNKAPTFACSHHVCQTALAPLFGKKTSFKCPVSGCNAVWQKNRTEVDKAFIRKMERFEAANKTQSQQGSRDGSARNAHDIDQEYTAV